MTTQRIAAKQVSAELRTSPVGRSLAAYLTQLLRDEREKYEVTVASEFQRGRISMLRDVLQMTKE